MYLEKSGNFILLYEKQPCGNFAQVLKIYVSPEFLFETIIICYYANYIYLFIEKFPVQIEMFSFDKGVK